MSDIIPFRRARLTGFLPDDLGKADAERQRKAREFYRFAKGGEPAIIARPEDFGPDDCA